MASYEDREAFIPYRRTDLIELCLEDGQLDTVEAQKFREFCSILSAYYHFQFHGYLESLKDNYAPFDPDADTKCRIEATSQERAAMESMLVADFKSILEKANYVPLSQESLQRAFEERSLIELKTNVDFNDFEQMVCYCRGDIYKIARVKKFFRKTKKKINVFERVVLLIKFKDESYFTAKKAKPDKLKFTPSKMYIYLYKNIPKFDIEFLFPNVKTSMTWKDRLLFGIPAIGAAIPLILRVLPQLLLVIGVILLVTVGPENLKQLKQLTPSQEEVRNIMPVLVAILSLAITLGGFAFKQYTSYKSKQIKFQKNVTETLFFRNLASNVRVFQSLIDAAEEEECKEIILVFYHLLTSNTLLTSEQLDNRIEVWMDEKFGTQIDFDIHGPLHNLEVIRGKIAQDGSESTNTPDISLLTRDSHGYCHLLSLDDALSVIDYIWDRAFLYSL
jgi:hypothetical protein